MCRPLPAGTALILAALVARAAADDDPTRAKLDQAKAAYGRSTERHRREVGEWFDGQVEKARGQKDKKAKDRLDEDRAAFDKTGLLPATAPKGLRDQGKAGRDALDRAFLAAVGDYTRGGKDKEAAATEREFVAFVRKSSAPRIAGRWARDRDGAVIAATANHEVAPRPAEHRGSCPATVRTTSMSHRATTHRLAPAAPQHPPPPRVPRGALVRTAARPATPQPSALPALRPEIPPAA